MLAQSLQRQRRFDEAVAVLRESVAGDPSNAGARMMLAESLAASGQVDEAIAMLETVLAQVPEDEQARISILRLLRGAGRDDAAESRVREWLATSPSSTGLRAELGIALMDLGRIEEAEIELRESMRGDVPRLDVLAALAAVEKSRGHDDRAVPLIQGEVERYPFNVRARWMLAGLHMDASRWDDAADEYRLLTEDTRGPEARRAWAQAVYNAGDYQLAREILAPLDPESSDDPDLLLLQVNILDKLGEDEIARSLFERGKSLRDAATAAP
jgi:predicted Zn-dependent protease